MDIYDLLENKKIKRYLTARNKIIYPDGIYHITQRAPGRELLFVEGKDYVYMLSLMKEVSKEFKWEIFSFALMPNHLHILLRISEANLSEGMKKLYERYAKYFNKKYERKGPVFVRPYRAALCLDDTYLISISIYIHLNPFKANLCKKLDGYKWSSLNLYLSDKKDSFIDCEFILRILDANDIEKARAVYFKLLSQAGSVDLKNIMEYPSYIEKFKDIVKKILMRLHIAVRSHIPEKEIERFSQKKYIREKEEMLARKYLIEQLRARGFKVREIAEKLKIDRKTIYTALRIAI
jgi:putative transposase